jgi:hypothetical protein
MHCDRLRIQLLVRQNETHPLKVTLNDIQRSRRTISQRLDKWRDLQSIHMPAVRAAVLSLPPSLVEDEQLFLPSHFSEEEREKLSVSALANDEGQLREGQAYECIMHLRFVVKVISTLHKKKRRKHTGSVRNTTRSRSQVVSMEFTRDRLLLVYKTSRTALAALGKLGPEGRFPPLSADELSRNSTQEKRRLGDSRRSEGHLWSLGSLRGMSS